MVALTKSVAKSLTSYTARLFKVVTPQGVLSGRKYTISKYQSCRLPNERSLYTIPWKCNSVSPYARFTVYRSLPTLPSTTRPASYITQMLQLLSAHHPPPLTECNDADPHIFFSNTGGLSLWPCGVSPPSFPYRWFSRSKNCRANKLVRVLL